ncbi:hypothetical protein [Chitinophaga alhagiae]|uniref:hypothetical protein n=1 Tax=Chitinophaga alhagiae TaxID=2203219 RepID=UPI000E5BB13E|nr:hypothetical protein [Chitinophaga alhagiae]
MATLTLHPFVLAGLLAAITYGIVTLVLRLRTSTKMQLANVPSSEKSLLFSAFDPASGMRLAPEPEMELEIEGIDDDTQLELVEDDTSILLKEAEALTEEVSRLLSSIASDPPNPTEVFTKFRALLSQYSIFQNTEFYDAINRFVAIAVERDLDIQFNHGQLTELWS